MCPQIACLRGCIVTLVAFVWLFSIVYFQVCPQIAWVRRSEITLVAFVGFFSTVCYQMCPQIACLNRGKVTQAAFVCLFSTVPFQMSPQTVCLRGCIVTLVAFFFCFLHGVSSNRFSNGLPERMHTYIDCIYQIFLQCAFLNVSSYCLHWRIHTHTGCFFNSFFTLQPHIISRFVWGDRGSSLWPNHFQCLYLFVHPFWHQFYFDPSPPWHVKR